MTDHTIQTRGCMKDREYQTKSATMLVFDPKTKRHIPCIITCKIDPKSSSVEDYYTPISIKGKYNNTEYSIDLVFDIPNFIELFDKACNIDIYIQETLPLSQLKKQ